MNHLRQPYISLLIGAFLGFFGVAVTFATLSLANPGWLRAALSGVQPGQPSSPSVPPDPAAEAPAAALTPVGPTAVPLPTVEGPCGGPEHITIALLGVDDRGHAYDFRARTDAITLVNVRFPDASAAMLSIPRDLYVPLPNLEDVGIVQSRINTAYPYGEIYGLPGGGPAEFKATVELNFAIRVDRYVLVNFGAFVAAVDALGGLDVDVPTAISDPAFPADDGLGTIVFELPAGPQHLDGQTALRYVRTRHQDDDYHRLARQQQVLLAIRDRLLRPQVIPQIPALIGALGNSVRTDLSAAELAALACIGPRIDRAAITALAIDANMVLPWTTPTGGRVSIPNREVIAPLVEQFLSQ